MKQAYVVTGPKGKAVVWHDGSTYKVKSLSNEYLKFSPLYVNIHDSQVRDALESCCGKNDADLSKIAKLSGLEYPKSGYSKTRFFYDDDQPKP